MLRRLLLLVLVLAPVGAAQSGPWTDLGNSLPGTSGPPQLQCQGALTAGSAIGLELTNAAISQAAYLVIGFTAINAPYKGGILVPNFDLLFGLWTDDAGTVSAQAHWPAGVPPGFEIYMQFWINDAGAVAGRAGSNAMMGVVP